MTRRASKAISVEKNFRFRVNSACKLNLMVPRSFFVRKILLFALPGITSIVVARIYKREYVTGYKFCG